MAVMPVMPRDSRDWTVDDLDQLPDDDGLQYELLDGVLLVSPAPTVLHQLVISRLMWTLMSACPPHLLVLCAPLDWQPDHRTSLQPDILVIKNENLGARNVTEILPLAVEVLSPSTRRKDLVLKHSKYQDVGVSSYWVVDPQVPSIAVWELVGEHYQLAGEVEGDAALTVRQPFPVTLKPSDQIR